MRVRKSREGEKLLTKSTSDDSVFDRVKLKVESIC